jgi:hypothetical protein
MPYGGTIRVDESSMQVMVIFLFSASSRMRAANGNSVELNRSSMSYEMRMDLLKTAYPPGIANLFAKQQAKQWVSVFAT